MAKTRDPYDKRLTPEKRDEFALWLCQEVQAALDNKAAQDRECDYWHVLYEQGRTRSASSAPWPGAADLTSYLGTQNVDSLHARLMKTVWVEPVWTVEGFGAASQNAPVVEELHQWWAEEEQLQGVLDKLSLISLIEPRGLLEVREGTQKRLVRKTINAAVMTDPMTGAVVYGEDGAAVPMRDEAGTILPAQAPPPPMPGMPPMPPPPAAEIVVDTLESVRTGPQYRIIPYRDSVILPGHARHKDDIWGYGKKFTKRMPEIEQLAKDGLYDKEQVSRLTHVGDTEPDPALQRSKQGIAPQEGPTAEKELWEVLVLSDLDGRGERWYLATLHLGNRLLLRLQYDDIDRSRFVPFILFPRTDRATEGFSCIGHKLITTIEEHTAWRNMIADRAAMVVLPPVKRLTGALWDPLEQPWGPSAVIDVRDMREVEPIQVPDVPASAVERERTMERTAEKLMGVNDIASGQTLQDSKTLGEVQMATEQSFVRMDLVIRRFQEAMEDLFQIRHAIRKRMLQEKEDGMELPSSVLTGLESRGTTIPGGRITSQMMEGVFRGKPRGSVETADPKAVRNDFNQLLATLPGFIQSMPMIVSMFGPQAVSALLSQLVRVYRIPNRQAFMGGPAQQQMLGQGQPPMGPPPAGGAPPLPLPGGPPQ
jgi:hypothetical protein